MLVAYSFTDYELWDRCLSPELHDILINEIAFWSEWPLLYVIIGLGETKPFSPVGGASGGSDE